jgi:hypothetical protein
MDPGHGRPALLVQVLPGPADIHVVAGGRRAGLEGDID